MGDLKQEFLKNKLHYLFNNTVTIVLVEIFLLKVVILAR